MEVGIEEINYEYELYWIWKLKVVYINTQLYFLFFHFIINFLVTKLGIFI
jgi:hypothetical protein